MKYQNVEIMDENIEYLLSKGKEYFNAGDIKNAFMCLFQAKSIDVTVVEPRLHLATACQLLKQYNEAIEEYEELLRLDEQNKFGHAGLASCLLAKCLEHEMEIKSIESIFLEDTQMLIREAEKHYALAMELGDTESSTVCSRGLCLIYLCRGEEAYQLIRKGGSELDPVGRNMIIDELARLGIIFVRHKGDLLNGRWCLLVARELNPLHPAVLRLEGVMNI